MGRGGRAPRLDRADLFDLHETVPLSRVDRMGLVWLLKGERVVLLTEAVARLERGLAVYRRPAAPGMHRGVFASGLAEDWQAHFDERAGIREFDGGMARDEAEAPRMRTPLLLSGLRRSASHEPADPCPLRQA